MEAGGQGTDMVKGISYRTHTSSLSLVLLLVGVAISQPPFGRARPPGDRMVAVKEEARGDAGEAARLSIGRPIEEGVWT